jgi:hypothetical protein
MPKQRSVSIPRRFRCRLVEDDESPFFRWDLPQFFRSLAEEKTLETRRLTTPSRLKEMASLLQSLGASSRSKATTIRPYEFTKEEAEACPLILEEDQFDYAFDETKDAMSEYERNFRARNCRFTAFVIGKERVKFLRR